MNEQRHSCRRCQYLKKFIKGKWFPLVIACACVFALMLILFCLGFRITYAPKLENSWDAVSAVATWVGVVASFVAIWFAIRVPKKIAEQQNKIALFEKRHDAYSSFLSLEVFAKSLDQEMFRDSGKDPFGQVMPLQEKVKLYCVHFATTLGYPPHLLKGLIDTESMTRSIMLVKEYEKNMNALLFLVYSTDDQANKMKQALSDIFEPLLCFITEVVTFKFDERDVVHDENRQKFIAAIKNFRREHADAIERELLIKTR